MTDPIRDECLRLADAIDPMTRKGLDNLTCAVAAKLLRSLAAPVAPPAISPSEAVYGFAGWLTGRDEPVTFGATHNAAIAAELVDAFCTSQCLDNPRQQWTDNLKPYPAAQPDPAWNRFHHIMNKHGLHPGRTDDDLLEILDKHLAAPVAQPQNDALAAKYESTYGAIQDGLLAEVARLKEAPAAPVAQPQKPVAWVTECDEIGDDGKPTRLRDLDWYESEIEDLPVGTKLYAAPVAQPWPYESAKVLDCEACLTPDACAIRGQCAHYLREKPAPVAQHCEQVNSGVRCGVPRQSGERLCPDCNPNGAAPVAQPPFPPIPQWKLDELAREMVKAGKSVNWLAEKIYLAYGRASLDPDGC